MGSPYIECLPTGKRASFGDCSDHFRILHESESSSWHGGEINLQYKILHQLYFKFEAFTRVKVKYLGLFCRTVVHYCCIGHH